MPNARAARTFSVSLSSINRYAQGGERGGSLAPKKRSEAAPKIDEKAMKLWEDLRERTFATPRERREYIGLVARGRGRGLVAPEKLAYVNESELSRRTSMAPLYGYAPEGGRLRFRVPRKLRRYCWAP